MKKIVAGLVVCLGLIQFPVSGELFQYNSGPLNQVISDESALGFSDTIQITGVDEMIESITVSFVMSSVDNMSNGDYYAYLRHDDLFMAVLLNRVGRTTDNSIGSWDSGFNLTFSVGASDIHTASYGGGVTTGDWGADGRETDPYSALDTDARTALLDGFAGEAASGDWTLFVADVSSGGVGQLDRWGLDIETVPEPTTIALISISGLIMLLVRRFKSS